MISSNFHGLSSFFELGIYMFLEKHFSLLISKLNRLYDRIIVGNKIAIGI